MNRIYKWLGAWTTLLVVSLSLISCEKDTRYLDRLADADLFNESMQKLTDVSKLNSLGWNHTVELEEGIVQIYNWYNKN